MATRIVAVSDTHCSDWEEVHPDIRAAVAEADIAVHCGDFTRMAVVEGLRHSAKTAVVVHGNSDPVEIRGAIPQIEVLEVEHKRIGVTHPAWGGPPFELGDLLDEFPGSLDAVVFGHLHETVNQLHNGLLFLNPGQGYSSFAVPATIAVLTIHNGEMSAEIRVIEPGR